MDLGNAAGVYDPRQRLQHKHQHEPTYFHRYFSGNGFFNRETISKNRKNNTPS